jgi:hypothetical protein
MKIDTQGIRLRWEADGSKRDERGKRLFAASEVRAAGYGGLAAVSRITGIARSVPDLIRDQSGRGRSRLGPAASGAGAA